MSSSPDHVSLLKTPSRKRTRGFEDDAHALNEAKRRRSSLPYALLLHADPTPSTSSCTTKADSRDRFLPALTTTEPFYPLNKTSPRSSRLARALGFVQPRLFSFQDDTSTSPLGHQLYDPTLPLRAHFSQGLIPKNCTSSSFHSAAKYGRMKPDRVLDSGPMDDFSPHPCAWSSSDMIAAVIRGHVFTHNMDTNTVSSLQDYGLAECVEWTSSDELAVGHDWGGMVLLDARTKQMRRYLLPVVSPSEIYSDKNLSHVNALNWNQRHGLLAVGRTNGAMSFYDPRKEKPVKNDVGKTTHSVFGVKWSPDGLFLASGHKGGIVRCMDWRAEKMFELKPSQRKTAHRGTVKSLTWAPWNPHLLATGGGASDHTVRIWSLSSSEWASQNPLHMLSFSSSVSSLHFSPHTTELLSTHGEPISHLLNSRLTPRSHSRRRSTGTDDSNGAPETLQTRHALLVHAYPSLQRVHAVPDAHSGPIVDSVLAPDGTRVITFGEDETLRVWTVWGARKQEKIRNMEDQYRIR